LKKRLAVLLALAMIFSATAVAAGPASALPPGNNGNHYGEYSNTNNGNHVGAGSGLGKYDNKRRGLR
jgi:hypothetical protein